mmetsp:Transcript_4440/g.8178  ORF Transcript_4440/g.8178 Transcript_4440/m.8178 type:complete len:366 (+) Transcript_4440:159-1256(+)
MIWFSFVVVMLFASQGWCYDPKNEPLYYKCRRDPTWRTVDYKECQELTGWYPQDKYWRDEDNTRAWLVDKYEDLPECLYKALDDAKMKYDWARCDESQKTELCEIKETKFMGHYYAKDQGQISTFANAFTEQEAYAVEALAQCIQEIMSREAPFYDDRAFGEDETEEAYGMYNEKGGNYCTYLQGLLQLYLPGVAATIYNVITHAVTNENWASEEGLKMIRPDKLGIRTAEFLDYKTTGKLGLHVDGGSVYSISVALNDEYEGGYFRLKGGDALFKVPTRGAIVFMSEREHAISDILGGERKVFVIELWEGEDVPVGLPRPTKEDFQVHKQQYLLSDSPVVAETVGMSEEVHKCNNDASMNVSTV